MRIGIIGCGTIAQVMHIPYVAELPEAELYALVDRSERRLSTLGDRYGVDHRYQETRELLASVGDELDAVVVCTPSHTHPDIVTQTLGAEIDTLVEKPLAATPSGADQMVEAERATTSDTVAMVAYMKRYDAAYERTQDAVADLDTIDLVTAYDVDPDHPRILEEVYDIVAADLPESVGEDSDQRRRDRIRTAIDAKSDALVAAYDFQIEHVIHDINALRGLFGPVEAIDHVDIFAEGRYATASLQYQDGIRCVLQSGDADRKWFEQSIRIDAPDGMISVDFSNPFIQNTPTTVRTKQGTDQLTDTVETPSYDESFKRELRHFIRCVRGEATVRTPFDEAADDVRVVADLFRTYRHKPRRGRN